MTWIVPLDVGLAMGLLLAWAVLALALAFRLLDFPDLTVEGSLPLGAGVFAVLHKGGSPMLLSILCAMVAGAMAGALTGFLHVRFKLNKFLAGIIVVAIAYSVSLRVMGASNIGLLQHTSVFDGVKRFDLAVLIDKATRRIAAVHSAADSFEVDSATRQVISFQPGSIALLTILLVGGAAIVLWGLATRDGMRLRVAGSNPEYARALGVNVPMNIVAGLAITNALAALSGTLLCMRQGFADISMGQGVLILALAAMTIGERLLPEKHLPFHVFVFFAAIVGSVAYQVLVAYAVRAGLAPTDLKLATAVLVLVVVALRVSRNGDLLSEGH